MARILVFFRQLARRKVIWQSLLLLFTFTLLAGYLVRRPQRLPRYVSEFSEDFTFERVAQPGFDEEGRDRFADSAWSMMYFQPDGDAEAYVYVGTDNNILGITAQALRRNPPENPERPPQIRRYRPDLGPEAWEVVLDYDDYEDYPYNNQGFRSMAVYRAQSDGVNYLYAATMATRSPTVWRSATGDPGTWELVFTFPYEPENSIGSIRTMVAHEDGLLYLATTRIGDIENVGLGQIWATDGEEFFNVVDDGFGDHENIGMTALASYAGCLYAGTFNIESGFEVWKLRCVDNPEAAPAIVIDDGGLISANETAMRLDVFNDHLYVGTGIPFGFNPLTQHGPRGCQLYRIDEDDEWDVVMGPRRGEPESDYRSGFGWVFNTYCWYMTEHEGALYVGTYDMTRSLIWLGDNVERVAIPFRPVLNYLVPDNKWGSPVGGDLYRSFDGIHWEPLFTDGLGNPDNHGIRTLSSTPEGLFIGTENPWTRLEVWRMMD